MVFKSTFFWPNTFTSIFIVLFLNACGPNNSVSNSAYFDLKNYFIAEGDLHNSLHDKAQKILVKGDHSETRIFTINNWIDELTPFIESDINKPSWKNSFTVDSMVNENKIQVTYLNKDKSVPVKTLIIEKIDQHISKITIETEKENIFYSAKSTMEYTPALGYLIKNRQKSFLSDPDDFELKVNFIQ